MTPTSTRSASLFSAQRTIACLRSQETPAEGSQTRRSSPSASAQAPHGLPLRPRHPCQGTAKARAPVPRVARPARLLEAPPPTIASPPSSPPTGPATQATLVLLDSTPLECGRSRETVERSAMAEWCGYGYRKAHSRFFWGMRLHSPARLTAPRAAGCWSRPIDRSARWGSSY